MFNLVFSVEQKSSILIDAQVSTMYYFGLLRVDSVVFGGGQTRGGELPAGISVQPNKQCDQSSCMAVSGSERDEHMAQHSCHTEASEAKLASAENRCDTEGQHSTAGFSRGHLETSIQQDKCPMGRDPNEHTEELVSVSLN